MPKISLIVAFTMIPFSLFGLFLPSVHSQSQDKSNASEIDRVVKPVATIRVTRTSLGSLLSNEFEFDVPFQRVVLETESQGTANCCGNLICKFEVFERGVAVCLVVSGTVRSESTGQNGPASISANCVTKYSAEKRLAFTRLCFVSQPATIESETKLSIKSIETALPGVRGVVVKRVAMRKAIGLRQEAERIVRESTSSDICKQLDHGVDEHVSYLNFLLRNRHASAYWILLAALVNLRSDRECIEVNFGNAASSGIHNSEKNWRETLVRSDDAP